MLIQGFDLTSFINHFKMGFFKEEDHHEIISELINYIDDIDYTQEESVQEVYDKLDDALDEVDRLEYEVAKLNDMIFDLESQVDDYKHYETENMSLNEELSDALSHVSKLEDEVYDLKLELDSKE